MGVLSSGGLLRRVLIVASVVFGGLGAVALSAAVTQAAVEDTAYTAVTPCASFDSRTDSGALAGKYTHDEARTFQITGPASSDQQGGVDCGVPTGADAVLINIVGIQADAVGNLRAYATGDTGTGGVVNYAKFTTAPDALNNSNAVVIPLSETGQLDIQNNCGGCAIASVHARGVVLGYFDDDLAMRVAFVESRVRHADPPCFNATDRFLDCGNGTVTDQVTGMIWLKNADCLALDGTWPVQSTKVANLASGRCGLADNSTAGDWRHPTQAEFEALWDPNCPAPTFPNDPGTGCASDGPFSFDLPPLNQVVFSTSTLDQTNLSNFIVMNASNGSSFPFPRSASPSGQPWPVRTTTG